MKEKDEYKEFVNYIRDILSIQTTQYTRKGVGGGIELSYETTLTSFNGDPFQLILDYFKKKTLPKLANCGTYYAVDNKGNWHYIGSDGEWNSMQSLECYWKNEGRKEILAELEADEQFEGDCICDECMEEEQEDFESYVREIVIDAFENNKDNIRTIVCGNKK